MMDNEADLDESQLTAFCLGRLPTWRCAHCGAVRYAAPDSCLSSIYLPTIRMENEPGNMGPRATRPAGGGGAFAGGGPNSAVMVSK
jgi:hypothetical protein